MALVTAGDRFDRALELLWRAALAAGVAVFAAIAVSTLVYPHELVVSEGAVGLGVRSILDGTPLYDAVRLERPPFVVLHYTPLYYLLVAPVMAASGAMFAGGRLVSIVFVLGTAGAAWAIARALSGSARAGAVAAGVWLSFYQVVFWGTTQRVDAPGIFFEAMGLWATLRARRDGRTPWGALPWFVAAWCVKQVMVVGLVAAAADTIRRDGKRGLAFALAAAGAIAAVFLGLYAWSGGAFWTATVLGTVSADADPPWVILSNAELFFGSPWNMLVFAVAAGGAYALRDRLLGIYLGFGLIFAIATDANFPRFFPPMLAMAVLAPVALERARAHPGWRRGLLASLVLFFASHLAYEMRPLVGERIVRARPGNARLGLAEALAARTRPDDRILAQDVGMLLSAGRRVEIADPLVMSILAGNGAWDPRLLAEDVRAGRYAAIVLNRPLEAIDDHEWTTLWIAPLRGIVAERYRLAETLRCDARWRFLEPERFVYVPTEAP